MEASKHLIEKIQWNVIPITVYRGCYLAKLSNGWEVLGQKVSKPEQVDEIIDKAGKSLKDSIVVVNEHDSISATNDFEHGNLADTDTGGMIGSQDEKQR